MSLDLYYMGMSPPCRVVLLVAKAVGVKLNLKLVDLMKGEHHAPDFVKINPQHTVPTLVDGDLVVSESRAIISYLVDQYGRNDALYPKDAKKRALVDMRLYFDAGSLSENVKDYFFPMVFLGLAPDAAQKKKVDDSLAILNECLSGQRYVAGIQRTIADYALVVTVSHAEMVGCNLSKHAHLASWYDRLKREIVDYDELNQKPANALGAILKAKLAEKKYRL